MMNLVERYRTSNFTGPVEIPENCVRVDDDVTTFIYEILTDDRDLALSRIYHLHMGDDHSFDWLPKWSDDRRYIVSEWPYIWELTG